jgi:hypothetical protein
VTLGSCSGNIHGVVGADFLTRVANSTVDEKGSTWTQFPGLLRIEWPFSLLRLDSSGTLKVSTISCL